MDVARLDRGLQIAGGAGIVLFISLFLPWYGVSLFGATATVDAWKVFSYVDLLLFLVSLIAIGAAAATAAGRLPSLPVPIGQILLGAGALALLLVLYRLIDIPGPGGDGVGRKLGIFIALIASGALAYAGSLLTKGTSYTAPVR